jgi:hypothetical protein
MNSYPNASAPTQPEFSGDVEFKKSNINAPAKYHIGESILSAKGLTKSDMSKLSTTISESWICNPSLIYRTDINGDAYVLITHIVLENKGEARTGKLDASINGKTTTLTINQIAANDTTTNTDNDLISKPRFEGENNISVKANTKTGSATLNVRNMTEEECTSKVVVYSNASWIKDINVTYTKKDN